MKPAPPVTRTRAPSISSARTERFGITFPFRLDTHETKPTAHEGVPRPSSAPSPASFTLTSYRWRATAGSWASRDGAWTYRFTKYCPVRFATVGDATRKIGVSAPFAGLLKNIRTTRKILGVSSLARFVLITPGWTAFTVTPVPASRRAYSTVKRICASFDWL